MALPYSSFFRLSNLSKTSSGVNAPLKQVSGVMGQIGTSAKSLTSSVGAAGSKVAQSKFGRAFAVPAGIGLGVGVGTAGAGAGIKYGLGWDEKKKGFKTVSGVIVFGALVFILVWAYGRVKK